MMGRSEEKKETLKKKDAIPEFATIAKE